MTSCVCVCASARGKMLDGCGLLAFARCCCVGGGEMESDARVSDEPGCGGGGGGGAGSVVEKGGGVVARRFGWAEIESVTGGFSSRVIGQGGFSTVYLASLTSSRLGAVKVQRSSERLNRAFCQERDVLLSLRHPHVVRLLGYCDERGKHEITRHLIDELYLRNLQLVLS